jgi:phage-related minor tail protein
LLLKKRRVGYYASSKIKDITIEIGGNTTKLGKALEGVNKQSKDLQSELKGVNSLLKLDPSNVELLKQKQDLLTKSINETKSKQKILAKTLKQIDSGKVKVTEEQYRDLQKNSFNR